MPLYHGMVSHHLTLHRRTCITVWQCSGHHLYSGLNNKIAGGLTGNSIKNPISLH
ncbi:hypothetical protein GYH30_001653 [Glycine max]|nr:hypothetical protein GYH30_001653 [Glycine max]